jgi:inner membrane protein
MLCKSKWLLTFAFMDSLTQIFLGAACGEIVLCKKIGNKAILFGVIVGTIPDLDIFTGKLLYNNEIQAIAFHRGFMHSILFAVLGAFLFG